MSSDAIVLMTVAAGSAAAAVIDLRTRRVPNALTMAIGVAGIALAATGAGRLDLAASLAGSVTGLALMVPGHVFGRTGAGDVKLLAAFGTLLGPATTVAAFLATAIAGGVLALTVIVRRRRFRLGAAENTFAYAPAIAIGATLAAFAGWGA